jgi:hypothetical protein
VKLFRAQDAFNPSNQRMRVNVFALLSVKDHRRLHRNSIELKRAALEPAVAKYCQNSILF